MKKKALIILLSALMITSLAACQSSGEQTETSPATVASTVAQTEKATENTTEAAAVSTQTLPDAGDAVTTVNAYSGGVMNGEEIFTDRDLRQTADTSEAKYYTISDNTDITIDSAGVYVFTGSASDMSIIVDAADQDKVQIVLNGVTISNSSAPAIYVKSADKVFVTTVSGTENNLSVTGTFGTDGDTNTDAVIFSKDDLVLNGLGTLTINSTDNGVTSKDDLRITGGTINVTCSSDAFEANDSIAVADGKITINTGKDGFHAENDEDNSKGYIYICGGTFDINAGSDGIQGTTVVQIDGGTFNITSSEGIEGTYIQINGGTVSITASDDGINGSAKSSSYSVKVEINDGNITVDMGQGDTDGIDSNGDIIINGGTVSVNGQSPFDYDGQGQINGGTVITNGEQVTELTNQFMGGGMGGPGGMMGGGMQGGGMQGGGMQGGGMQGGRGGF